MKQMGYKTCLSNPDLWMIPNTKKNNELKYYMYVLIYVDDVLVIGDDLEEVLKLVDKYFGLKPGSLADPNIYMGARVKLMALPNGFMEWLLSPSKYVQEAVNIVETYVKDKLREHWKIPKTSVNSFPIGYETTEDVTPELDPELALYYQSIIGVLIWMVELGQININTEILMLASHLVLPR